MIVMVVVGGVMVMVPVMCREYTQSFSILFMFNLDCRYDYLHFTDDKSERLGFI